MIYILKIASCFLQSSLVLSNIFGIPGNLVSLLFPLLWASFGIISWNIFFTISLIVAVGEGLEFASGYFLGKKYGIDNKSFWVSMICSILFTIVMAPLFFGIGAVIGAFLGAFVGTYTYEIITSKDKELALKRAFASLRGRFLGVYLKIIVGFIAVGVTVKYLFT